MRRPLPCVRCGYDLEGLPALGQCPECGRSVVDSLAAGLELEPSTQPPVPYPLRLAITLFLGAFGALGGSLVFGAVLVELALDAISAERWIGPSVARLLSTAATALTLSGLLGFLLVLPWTRLDRFVRSKVLGIGGFALWAAASMAEPAPMTATYTALPASMVLVALAPLLSELGPRSPDYRKARATRQRVRALLVSTALAGGASATAAFLELQQGLVEVVLVLRIVAVSSAILTLVGFGYLSLNAAWIMRSTLRPPLLLEDAIAGSDEPPTPQGRGG